MMSKWKQESNECEVAKETIETSKNAKTKLQNMESPSIDLSHDGEDLSLEPSSAAENKRKCFQREETVFYDCE